MSAQRPPRETRAAFVFVRTRVRSAGGRGLTRAQRTSLSSLGAAAGPLGAAPLAVRILLGLLALTTCLGCSAPSDPGGMSADGAVGDAARQDDAGTSSGDLAQESAGLTPARGGGSGGSGGGASNGIAVRTVGTVTYRLLVPAGYSDGNKTPLLLVYSGTEGGGTMAQNLVSLAQPVPSSAGYIRAVLDGVDYRGDGEAGAAVLDELRAKYDIDNDRTYLLGESAGTTAAFELGFHLRQAYFAAYWANDVSAVNADGPAQSATELGFAPWGQVGPGGALALATAIADNLRAAGYRTDAVTPYAGAGATTHGSPQQFIAALSWLDGKSR